jgi:SAM-dependent methyltransferase
MDSSNADRHPTLRPLVRQLAQQSWDQNDPTGWFETLYANAQGDPAAIPWADLAPNPNLVQWLQQSPRPAGTRALIVGCGLGDDAELLTELGWTVTAFDVSSSAIAWCQSRFDRSDTTYQIADLLDLPADWQAQFDFVVEAYTLQALPAEVRAQAIPCVAACVAPGGTLLVIARGRDEADPVGLLPFPLTRSELQAFCQSGLTLAQFEDYIEPETPPARRFRVEYRR